MQDFLNYIPLHAQPYCKSLREKYSFKFILKRSRLTKLGDFRVNRASGQYSVSVNRDLNPYQFLITFIHELAHLKVAEDHPRSVKSHGAEWKNAFKELHKELKVFENHPYEKRSFMYLDIISWLESKIENVSVESIIKKKSKQVYK